MANELADQLNTIERSLGECMIDTALVVVRAWLTEIGENNPYEEAFTSIQKRYHEIFTQWLNIDVPSSDEELSKITGETYQMVDAVYADIRLLRWVQCLFCQFGGLPYQRCGALRLRSGSGLPLPVPRRLSFPE